MRFILVAAAKDVRRRLSDPAALAIWIGIPLLLAGLMSLVAGDGNVRPRANVLVVDQDNSIVSRLLIAASGTGTADLLQVEAVGLADGLRRIDDGEATALLVLPKGLQEALLLDAPAQIELITNPAERILPGIVEEALKIVVEGVFYAQRLVGEELRRGGTSRAPSDADIAAMSTRISERMRALQTLISPLAMRVEMKAEDSQQPALGFGQIFLPGVLFMSFLFIAQGMSSDIWEEKTLGTLRRALAAPQPSYRLLAGKLVAGATLVASVGGIALLAAIVLFDVAWTRVPFALVWCTFAGVALLALLTLLQTLATSARGGEMIASVVVFPLMMLGGSFFPFETMPGWMAAIGQWTPNGLAVLRLKEILFGDPSIAPLLVSAAGVGVPATASFLLAARRLRRIVGGT